MKSLDLIKMYLESVVENIPENRRLEVKRKVKSEIVKALKDKVGSKSEYKEEVVVAVLQDLGSPEEVAARYALSPTKYLIGPHLLGLYVVVLMIVFGAAALGIAISNFVRYLIGAIAFWEVFTGLFFGILSSSITIIGSLTILFALLERFLPEEEKEGVHNWKQGWDPPRLPSLIKTSSKVKRNESAGDFFFTLGALILFHLIFFTPFIESRTGWEIMEVINRKTLASFRPFINTLWIMELFHYALLWKHRTWSMASRFFTVFFSGASTILLILLASSSLIDLEGLQFFAGTIALEEHSQLESILSNGVRASLVIGALFLTANTVIEGAKLYKILQVKKREVDEEEENEVKKEKEEVSALGE